MFSLNFIERLSLQKKSNADTSTYWAAPDFFKGQPLQKDKTLLSSHASSHLTGRDNFILSDFRSTVNSIILKNITSLLIKFNGIFIEFTLKI